jgi:hypothetical protein
VAIVILCGHFLAFSLLLDEILPDSSAYEELIGTGWVQNYTTYEFCPKGEA